MLRSLYVLILNLHPAAFRQRFGDEMLDIVEHAVGFRAKALLLADGLLSLIRQWTVRSEFRQPSAVAATPVGPSDVPLFRTIEPYKPGTATLLHGGLLSIAILCGVVTAIGHGGKPRWFVIGVHHSSPHLIPVDRSSIAETDLNTTVEVADPEDPWSRIAGPYFRVIRALSVLDADKDLVISPRETLAAPATLRRLDADHDGKLSPEECGFFMAANLNISRGIVNRARTMFMRENPVLAALDPDHDGEISSAEIAAGSSALKTLDRNRDGSLTPDELLPDQRAIHAAMITMRLDTNDDGAISSAERVSGFATPFRDLLDSADRNHDGLVTRQELNDELNLSVERKRQLDAARRGARF